MPTNYRVPVLEKFAYQPSVKDKDLATPPVSPVKGDRYIVAASATGAWLGQDKNIAWYDGAVWKFDVPSEGWQAWVEDENKYYFYSGTLVWSPENDGDMRKAVYDTDANGVVDAAGDFDAQLNTIVMKFP